MKVKIDTACVWGEGDARKRYEAGSVIEVPVEVQEKNSTWMKATDEELKEAPAAKKADGDK
jgi:hypothetical protein